MLDLLLALFDTNKGAYACIGELISNPVQAPGYLIRISNKYLVNFLLDFLY